LLATSPETQRYIVLNELQLVYLPRARFTIAEEVCHRMLEWDLWKSSKIPEGAHAHELSDEQYSDIEHDARCLAVLKYSNEILRAEAEGTYGKRAVIDGSD
jgi:hypothetical protein